MLCYSILHCTYSSIFRRPILAEHVVHQGLQPVALAEPGELLRLLRPRRALCLFVYILCMYVYIYIYIHIYIYIYIYAVVVGIFCLIVYAHHYLMSLTCFSARALSVAPTAGAAAEVHAQRHTSHTIRRRAYVRTCTCTNGSRP